MPDGLVTPEDEKRVLEGDVTAGMPRKVRVVEVGPRDGLQNESMILETEDKVRLVELLADAGFSDIEVSSFVHPERVPQLADAAEVFAALTPREDVRYSALVPNRRGLDRAVESGVSGIAVFTAASETFTQRNIGMSIAQSLDVFQSLMPVARHSGMWVRAYVSTAFVCPFEGRISSDALINVVLRLLDMEVDEISVGDTIGHAVPTDVAKVTEALLPVVPLGKLAYHFHDTRGAALANVLMALQYGVFNFDSATGGAGGCPFAPGASGNLATEDLLGMLHGMGIETGVNLEKMMEASLFLEAKLGKYLPAKYLQAALLPEEPLEP